MQNALANSLYAQMHTQNFHGIRPNKCASSIMLHVTRSKITYNPTVNFNVSALGGPCSFLFPIFLSHLLLVSFFLPLFFVVPRRNIRESSKRRFSFYPVPDNLASGTFRSETSLQDKIVIATHFSSLGLSRTFQRFSFRSPRRPKTR